MRTTQNRASVRPVWKPSTASVLIALALAHAGCASDAGSTRPLGASGGASGSVAVGEATPSAERGPEAAASAERPSAAIALTPVAQPAPGPMPSEPATASGGQAAQPPRFTVSDAGALRAAKAYVVETEGDGAGWTSADRFWSDLLAQTLDEYLGETLASASDRGEGVIVVRPRVRVGSSFEVTADGPACRVEIIDASTGATIATFEDASTPARLSAGDGARAEADLGRAAVRVWAEQVAQRTDAVRSEPHSGQAP